MEKIVTKRSLKEFREKENPWKYKSFEERMIAMREICEGSIDDQNDKQGFPRVYKITRGKKG